jgi:hypothetical protein
MKPIEVNTIMRRSTGRFSAVGPPRIRRSRSAGSLRIRNAVVNADAPKKIPRYIHACQ